MGVKRWLLVVGAGVVLTSVGLTWIIDIEVLGALERSALGWLGRLLGWLPLWIAPAVGLTLGVSGLTLIGFGLRGMIRSLRSEERRVGKECRSRWSRHQYEK